jgi:NADPH-dependent curcumin reductase CurA
MAAIAATSESKSLCRQVLLKERPTDKPSINCFEVKSSPRPTITADGDVLVRVLYLSVDPYMRGRIGGDASRSSRQPLAIGGMLPGATVGEVVESRYPSLLAGDVVCMMFMFNVYLAPIPSKFSRVIEGGHHLYILFSHIACTNER